MSNAGSRAMRDWQRWFASNCVIASAEARKAAISQLQKRVSRLPAAEARKAKRLTHHVSGG
jgi:hypothetical protein